ncbi:unnamed protein product [Calypogeia fissa]
MVTTLHFLQYEFYEEGIITGNEILTRDIRARQPSEVTGKDRSTNTRRTTTFQGRDFLLEVEVKLNTINT